MAIQGDLAMKFTKMHGIANDYIYINCFKEQVDDPSALAIRLSDRRRSVGGDGVILICPSDKADFRMRMFNADGSEGKMCGNGSRCVAKYVYDKGLTKKTDLTLETLAGIKTLKLHVEGEKVLAVTVGMGKADFSPEAVPVLFGSEMINSPIEAAGREWKATAVSMGNPHCVIFCDEDVLELPLEKIGPQFENHRLFPDRVNTEFVNVIDRNTLKMRVWERGSGETMACGTGACAVAAAAVRNGISKAGEKITVRLLGGDLKITVSEDWSVSMTGPAETAFEGEI